MKTICFDFDGVIAKFDGWRGADYFGAPQREVIETMKALHSAGYRIIIWTTRRITGGLKDYLFRNNIPYHSINSTRHNPPGTSEKPIYHAYIDDRAIQYRGQDCAKLIRGIEHLINNGTEIFPGEKTEIKKVEG